MAANGVEALAAAVLAVPASVLGSLLGYVYSVNSLCVTQEGTKGGCLGRVCGASSHTETL